MKKHKVITRFLQVIGATHEANRYLKLFQKGEPARFAVIKIGGRVLEKSLDLIAMDLAYLSSLNLYPIIIHGGGPQIDNALSQRGITTMKIDGQRMTTRKQLAIIECTLCHINAALVERVRDFNGAALGLTEDIFIADKHPDERLGYVGTIRRVNIAPIIRAVKNKKIPVLSCVGYDEKGRVYNINADTAAKAVVLAVRPKKYIIITEEGGIRDRKWSVISNVNLFEEYDHLMGNGALSAGMFHKICEIKALLDEVHYNLPVQITSGKELLRELFTNKGSGTFIKKGGNIKEYDGYENVDIVKLRRLIESSFERKLRVDFFRKSVHRVFLDRDYHGVAIVRDVHDICYLDKFCVRKETQGEGVAADLWHHLQQRCKSLFWRARPDNAVNRWYFEKADGVLKQGGWNLFWCNLTEDQVKIAAAYAFNLEESFKV